MTQCSARTKDGQQCTETPVEGYAVCHLHGAGSPHLGRPGGRPLTHGAYSRAIKPEEAATLEDLRALGAGLEEEMAVARLQLSRALAWAAAERSARCDGKQCPYALVDSRLGLVSRLAERYQRIATAQSRDDACLARMQAVIDRYVPHAQLRIAIMRDLKEAQR